MSEVIFVQGSFFRNFHAMNPLAIRAYMCMKAKEDYNHYIEFSLEELHELVFGKDGNEQDVDQLMEAMVRLSSIGLVKRGQKKRGYATNNMFLRKGGILFMNKSAIKTALHSELNSLTWEEFKLYMYLAYEQRKRSSAMFVENFISKQLGCSSEQIVALFDGLVNKRYLDVQDFEYRCLII